MRILPIGANHAKAAALLHKMLHPTDQDIEDAMVGNIAVAGPTS